MWLCRVRTNVVPPSGPFKAPLAKMYDHRSVSVCLVRGLGWGAVAYGAIDLIRTVIVYWFPSTLSTPASSRVTDLFLAQAIRGITVVVCGLITIRTSTKLIAALCAAFLAMSMFSFFMAGRLLRYSLDLPFDIANVSYAFHAPFAVSVFLLCLLNVRKRLHFERGARLCPTCRYDLRGITSLKCTECARTFTPLEFYALALLPSTLLVRSVAIALIAFGLGDIATQFDIVIYSIGLGKTLLAADVSLADRALPSLFAASCQVTAGLIEVACGVAAARSPWLLWRAACLVVAVIILKSSVDCHGWLTNSYNTPSHTTQILDSFHVSIVGLVTLVWLFPIRSNLNILRPQRPVCRNCCAIIINPKDLCCDQCGHCYSPTEFVRLGSGIRSKQC